MPSLALILSIAIALLAIAAVAMGIRTVPQGQRWTVERFGRFTRELSPGLNIIIPFIDLIGRRMVVQEIVLDIPEQTVITQDNATIKVDGIIYYTVNDVPKAAYAVQDLQRALMTLAMTNIRSEIGSMARDKTLSERVELNKKIQSQMAKAAETWGVTIGRVELLNIEPPQHIQRAMDMQSTAERERRAVVTRAEGEREAAIARANGVKQSEILEAEGRAIAAEQDAKARIALAEAEAQAIEKVAAAANKGPLAVSYFTAIKSIEATKDLASSDNSKLIVVPQDSAAMAGAVSQLMQLVETSRKDAP